MSWIRGHTDVLRTRLLPLGKGRRHHLAKKLIVSLTSHPPRFPTLDLTLRCLLSQSVQPDLVVLWLTTDERRKLPERVERLLDDKFEVRTVPHDIGPYKKIIPALLAYPDAFIVTADDDVVYGRDWLRTIATAHRDRQEITCLRSRRVKVCSGLIAPYSEWERENDGEGIDVCPTGFGGVLYPPGVLPIDKTTDAETFMKVCPRADDIWLYWMAARESRMFRCIPSAETFRAWRGTKSSSLFHFNTMQGGNDLQIAAMAQHFGGPAWLAIESTAHADKECDI